VLTHAKMPQEPWLWSTVAFTIVLSVFVHGVLATPVLSRLERRGEGAAA
jgi:NhaP-type Na+/H+ or K+/H+ antiporter